MGMSSSRPTTVTILFLALATSCVADVAGTEAPPEGAGGKADGGSQFIVNGHTLNAREQQWMRYLAGHVVPKLVGTPARKLQIASRTAWWSLKEGIFDTENPPKYSNCNAATGDHLLGPLDTCGSGRAWQVGLAAVQVPNHSLSELEALAEKLYPDQSVAEVLAGAAAEAGFDASSATAQAIVGSTDSLRKSWLLRNSAIGFTACEQNEVVPECIDGSKGWCYGTSWDTTSLYAPNKPAAMRAIADISTLLDQLISGGGGSQPASPWIGSACQSDADCGFSSVGAQGFCFLASGTSGFCSLVCDGYCPDQTGRSTTFCVAKATGGGMCVVEAGAPNHDCADLPGTQPYEMDRFIQTSSAPAATAEVCGY